jgi:hypothetical protein
MGMCGPTLSAVKITTGYPALFTPENQTAARAALEGIGFAYSSGGPYAFFMARGNETVMVQNRTGDGSSKTTLEFRLDIDDYEAGAGARAHRIALLTPYTWGRFNETMAPFERTTGWRRDQAPVFGDETYVC